MMSEGNKRVGELVRGVFRILLDNPEGLAARAVLERLESIVPPTDFEKSEYPNLPGVQRFKRITRFATIGPVKAGWMIKDKGKWYITEEGKLAFQKYQNPEEFTRESDRLYYQWANQRPDAQLGLEQENANAQGPSVGKSATATSTFEEAEEIAWGEIERFVQAMNPYDLQKLVAGLLRAMGYHVSSVAPRGPDGGTDIIAHNDPLGISPPRIKVQVKRHEGKTPANDVRSFLGVLGEGDVGIFVSTGGFTRDTEFEARAEKTRRLTLVNLEELLELWIQNYDKIEDSDKLLLPLKPVYYLAPSD
jgi:restriction system protein